MESASLQMRRFPLGSDEANSVEAKELKKLRSQEIVIGEGMAPWPLDYVDAPAEVEASAEVTHTHSKREKKLRSQESHIFFVRHL